MGGSKKQTVGHKYFMGIHFAVCQGPVDALQEIRVGDRIAWSGSQTANGTISIAQPDLFGGDKKEGGIEGDGDVLMGGSAQTQNSYLAATVSSDSPSYRGILSFIWKKGLVAANNPYIKPWAFKVKRILQGWHGGTAWYSAKAEISGDMNPAHIIYQCDTDPTWGMGYPTAQIDDANFRAVADTLHTEGFGLSMIWNQQQELGAFVGQVLDHIGGIHYVDPTTGKFALKLIRGDYNPVDLPVFNESNVRSLDSFQRVGYGDTVNELTVVYRDGTTGKDTAITVQDLANIQATGAVVSTTRQYPGITKADLAARVAMRDLVATSTPLAKIQMQVNRSAWALIPGDVFKLSWPTFGLSEVIFRVLSIDRGTLSDGEITVTAAEDVFGLPASTYAAQQPSGWVEPDVEPQPVTTQDALEATYYQLATSMTAADFALVDPVDAAYFTTVAARPAGLCTDYTLWSKVGVADYEEQQVAPFTPTATVGATASPDDTAITYANGVNVSDALIGKLVWIGSGATAEAVELQAVDTGTSTITVKRGCIDTVPRTHSVGARIWFCGDTYLGFDQTERATGETVDFKLTTIATGGELDIDDPGITVMSRTAAQRFARPYPPGWLRINGSSYPATITGDATISWAHRDRTLQTAGLIGDGDGNVGPEAGVTYTLRLYGETDNLLRTVTGLTGTSYAFTDELAISGLGTLGPVSTLLSEDANATLTGWEAELGDVNAIPLHWTGSQFVAYDYNLGGSQKVYTSPDGLTWTTVSGGTMPNNGPYAYGGGYYLANGGTQYSTDLVTWTGSSSWSQVWLLMWDGSQFVRISYTGDIQTSATGASWSTVVNLTAFTTAPALNASYSLAKHGSTYFLTYNPPPAGGLPPQLWTSSDLATWTQRASAELASWDSAGQVVYDGSGVYVIAGVLDSVGEDAAMLRSTDGTTFSSVTAPAITGVVLSSHYADGQFWIFYNGSLAVSSNGSTWTKKVIGDFTLTMADPVPDSYALTDMVTNGTGTRLYNVQETTVVGMTTYTTFRTARAINDSGAWSLLGSSSVSCTAPSIAALNDTDLVFADRDNDELRLYRWNGSSWASTGTPLSVSMTNPGLVAINSTDVALIDSSFNELRTYRWNGTTFAQVGSGLAASLLAGPQGLARLSATRIAHVNGNGDTLRAYDWSGSAWSTVGSAAGVGSAGNVSITALNSTDIVFVDSSADELRLYRFNGSAWSQVGSSFSIANIAAPIVEAINGTDVAFYDTNIDRLRVYRWSGSAFSLLNTELTITSAAGRAWLTNMGGSRVAFIDDNLDSLRMYRWTPDIADMYAATLVAPTPATVTRDTVVYAEGSGSVLLADPWEMGVGAWKSFASILNWSATQITIEAYMRAATGQAPELWVSNYTTGTPSEHIQANSAYNLVLNLAAGKVQFRINTLFEKAAVSYAIAADTWYKVKAVVNNNSTVDLYLYAADGTTLLGSTLAASIGSSPTPPSSGGLASFLLLRTPGWYDAIEVTGASWTPRLNDSLRVKLKAVRDGLDSYQEHDYTVAR